MDYFDTLARKIKDSVKKTFTRIKKYIKKLLFPIYLFPLKLISYSVYYTFKFFIKLLLALIGLTLDAIVFPFKSLKNFLKSLVIMAVGIYLLLSFLVIIDYLKREYGGYEKTLCAFGFPINRVLQNSVVRIVGGYSEGSGFFVNSNQILTNFHVIADEPSPKIILPSGEFLTPYKVIGDKGADLALLFIDKSFPELVLEFPAKNTFYESEPLVAAGYALGTDLSGKATVVRGNFIEVRKSKELPVAYIQTNISLVKGMSGGPIADQCGRVMGINTQSLAGLSLFILGSDAKALIPTFTDQSVTKINVDPSESPEEAVKAFYTYLKARRMEEGFGLLSETYLQKTNIGEWTSRFTDVLDVDVISTKLQEGSKDTVFIKFSTKNWVDGEAELHHYEGTWQTIQEDGVYKMLKSNIKEIENPGWEWFYE